MLLVVFLIWTWFFSTSSKGNSKEKRACHTINAHLLNYGDQQCHRFILVQATMTTARCHEYFTGRWQSEAEQRRDKPYQFGICSHYYSWPRAAVAAIQRSCFQTHILIIFQVSSSGCCLLAYGGGGGQYSHFVEKPRKTTPSGDWWALVSARRDTR